MIIFAKENQELNVNTYQFNMARILTELATIIEIAGGRVQPIRPVIVKQRDITDRLYKCKQRLSLVKNPQYRADLQREYLELMEYPISAKVTHTTQITFCLDDNYYFYQADVNPLFPSFFMKTPLIDKNTYVSNAMMEKDDATWLTDTIVDPACSEKEIKEMASKLFMQLYHEGWSPIVPKKETVRVPNTYDHNYHTETIQRYRTCKIDF